MKMYHGSLVDIKGDTLKANKPFETLFYQSAVYLTQKKELAILHALNPIRIYAIDRNINARANAFSCHFRNVLNNKITTVFECYEGMLDELFRHKVYFYSVDIDDEIDDYDDFACKKDIKYQTKEVISDVRSFLQESEREGRLKFIKFKDLNEKERYHLFDSIESRANSCEHDIEIAFFKEKFADNPNVLRKLHINKFN